MIKIRLIVLFLLSVLTLAAQQSPQVKDLEKRRKAALEDIEATNQLLNENKQTTNNALYRLNLLTRQINSRKEIVTLLNKEIESLDFDIQSKELTVNTLERELKQKKSIYAESLRKMYAHKNNQDKLLFILSAQDFTQSYRRFMYLKEYSGWQKKKAEEIIEKQKIIIAEKVLLLKNKEDKLALVDQRKKEEDQLTVEEGSQKEEIQTLKKEQKTLVAELNKKKKQADALNNQIEKIIAEEIARAQREARMAAEAKALAAKNAEKAKNEEKSKSEKKERNNKKTKTPAVIITPESVPTETRVAETTGGYAMTQEERTLSSSFVNNKGNLPFPVKGNYKIVGHFGPQQHPDLPYVTTNNNGIEIQTTAGNSARCIFDGIVSSVFVVNGYNTSVIIRHGDYLSLYSNLEEVFVKKGDAVKTGQNIGKIFTDREKGNTTTIHFEIRKGVSKLNPESWLGR